MDQQQHQVIKTEGVEPSLNGGANAAIELAEHTPGTIAIEEAVGVTEEVGEWVQEGDQMKRVKVCSLPACLLIANRLTPEFHPRFAI
jgi:protein phosphatase-4 regulatory subunit 3